MKSNDCRGCFTYLKVCILPNGECPCKVCLIKMICTRNCKDFISYYKQFGILYFNKKSGSGKIGGNININLDVIKKEKK